LGVSDMGGAYIHTDTPPTGIEGRYPFALASTGTLPASLAHAGTWPQLGVNGLIDSR